MLRIIVVVTRVMAPRDQRTSTTDLLFGIWYQLAHKPRMTWGNGKKEPIQY
jgi:hypothetical protein